VSLSFALRGLVFACCLALPAEASAQSCGSTIKTVNLPKLNVYETSHGAKVGTITKSKLPNGTVILECASNGRLLVPIGTQTFWIDGYAVQPNIKRVLRSSKKNSANTAGGRGFSQ
jgi:hypothetical protein